MDQGSNLDNLYLLTKVIEAGGFSAAARQTGVTRSLLSRRIIELEQHLGVRLLHRNARSFAVTAVGEQVYRHAVTMCDAASAAAASAREAQGQSGGLVRVAAAGLLSPLLNELMSAFDSHHPHTRLSMTSGSDGVAGLLKQNTDVVLSMADMLPDSSDIVARPLATVRMVVVASPALLQQLDHPTQPNSIEDRHFLGYIEDGAPRHWNLRGVPPRQRQHRLSSDSLSTLLASAVTGMGFAQLPMYACHAELASGRLRLAFEGFEARPARLHALTMSGNAVGETTLGLVQFLREQLATRQAQGISSIHRPA